MDIVPLNLPSRRGQRREAHSGRFTRPPHLDTWSIEGHPYNYSALSLVHLAIMEGAREWISLFKRLEDGGPVRAQDVAQGRESSNVRTCCTPGR